MTYFDHIIKLAKFKRHIQLVTANKLNKYVKLCYSSTFKKKPQ